MFEYIRIKKWYEYDTNEYIQISKYLSHPETYITHHLNILTLSSARFPALDI